MRRTARIGLISVILFTIVCTLYTTLWNIPPYQNAPHAKYDVKYRPEVRVKFKFNKSEPMSRCVVLFISRKDIDAARTTLQNVDLLEEEFDFLVIHDHTFKETVYNSFMDITNRQVKFFQIEKQELPSGIDWKTYLESRMKIVDETSSAEFREETTVQNLNNDVFKLYNMYQMREFLNYEQVLKVRPGWDISGKSIFDLQGSDFKYFVESRPDVAYVAKIDMFRTPQYLDYYTQHLEDVYYRMWREVDVLDGYSDGKVRDNQVVVTRHQN